MITLQKAKSEPGHLAELVVKTTKDWLKLLKWDEICQHWSCIWFGFYTRYMARQTD